MTQTTPTNKANRRGKRAKKPEPVVQLNDKPFIGSVEEADSWMIRPHIQRGYRIGFTSYKQVMKSLFMWHNETSNTWSHLLGAFVFIWFFMYVSFYMELPQIPSFKVEWCQQLQNNTFRPDFLHSELTHPEPSTWHAFYNHHSEQFERVELFLRDSMDLFKAGKHNLDCMRNVLLQMPKQLEERLQHNFDFVNHKLGHFYNLTRAMAEKMENQHDFDHSELLSPVPRWPLYAHALSGVIMLLFSAYYHNGCCQSHGAREFLLRLDYVGISVMISGSSIPPFYYSLMCEQTSYIQYYSIVLAACSGAAILMMNPKYVDGMPAWFNAVVFISAGTSPIFGVCYIMNLLHSPMLLRFDIWPWVYGCVFYFVGALCFAFNWPECLSKKGRFDFIGSSHNIFHVCIVVAALIHWYGSIKCFHERQLYTCPVQLD